MFIALFGYFINHFYQKKIKEVTISDSTLRVEFAVCGFLSQLDFLKNIDVRGELFYEESFITNAIRRYENLWIPLVHKLISQDNSVDELDLGPPLGKKFFCFQIL